MPKPHQSPLLAYPKADFDYIFLFHLNPSHDHSLIKKQERLHARWEHRSSVLYQHSKNNTVGLIH